MIAMGEQGYIQATRKILESAAVLKEEIRKIPDLHILGNPLWVIAFGSTTLDIYRVMDCLSADGWSLNGLHKPSCVHLCVTLRHAQPGIIERFIRDLRKAVAMVKSQPEVEGGMAPVYGLAATLPVRSVVAGLLERYMDLLYKL